MPAGTKQKMLQICIIWQKKIIKMSIMHVDLFAYFEGKLYFLQKSFSKVTNLGQ